MRQQFFLMPLLLIFHSALGPNNFFKQHKIKKYTEYRERFLPNRIKKEVCSYIIWDTSGNIVEITSPYYSAPIVLQKYFYNKGGLLIGYIAYKKDSTVAENWTFKNVSDTSYRKMYTPSFEDASRSNEWKETLNLLPSNPNLVKIDTIFKSSNKHDYVLNFILEGHDRQDTLSYFFKEKKISFIIFPTTKNFLKFDKQQKVIERTSTTEGFFHFKYWYFSNGLLKKIISYQKDGQISEVETYKIEYY